MNHPMLLHLLTVGTLTWVLSTNATHAEAAKPPLFDMDAMRDASTLETAVVKDWHVVEGRTPTRQKLVEITVGEAYPGKKYRVPVQFIVPKDRKAKGFSLSSGAAVKGRGRGRGVGGHDAMLITAGVGIVKTHIGNLPGDLKKPRDDLFYKTLDPRYRNFWIWPATFMRTITAAYAEPNHFEKGKILVSGFSKVGETSAVTLINDDRVTAAFGQVCPIYASPIRLSDPDAMAKLDAFNRAWAKKKGAKTEEEIKKMTSNGWLSGLAGPGMKPGALAAGKTWDDLRELANNLADQLFISRNVAKLKTRGAEFFFQPGTHDMVSYDGVWGGANAQDIPVYNGVNSGHGGKGHPQNLRAGNRTPFILAHFLGSAEPMLSPPATATEIRDGKLHVAVTFPTGSEAESGRIFWIFNRGPDASVAYQKDVFPDENWKEMVYDKAKKAWTVEIDLDPNASHIDVFSNHQKTLSIGDQEHTTAISSPYTRVKLRGTQQ